ncbi:MAG: hypothetical protein GWN01_14240, partial [Nitrosopumilaceae archaeon]|nr:hypothetical protein [Nitrosopumilaceae archaeon]NIU88402.1 hypothetical protein [Nitrosopumilaceae archaeon]NIV66677.1 hypothetical protein [Nitrosopumilaceae archaeon]NIX62617.1 hypothetical protein [Nitrosopumilaceae archaeon]
SPPGEIQRYAAQYGNQAERVVEMLKQARLEIMQDSTTRTLLLFIVFGGLILASIQKWIKTEYAIISVVFLIIFDLGIISHDYLKGKFRDPDKIETQNYQETEIDRTIEKDTTL